MKNRARSLVRIGFLMLFLALLIPGAAQAKKTAKKKNSAEGVGDALMKVALGCSVAEVTEEYAEVDGKLKLLKRKKTKKDIPPDLKAVQLILEKQGGGGGISALSDEELEKEKQRLLKLLNGNAEQ